MLSFNETAPLTVLSFTQYKLCTSEGKNANHPFSAHETIFGLVLKKNDSDVKSMRNLNVKCEV